MNKIEFLAALRQALTDLPPEEQGNAVQYYEDYFEDAGVENEQKVIAELGSPELVAQAIRNDYRDVATAPQGTAGAGGGTQSAPHYKKGISPWLLLVLVIFAVPVGIPLLAAGLAVIASLFAVVLVLALVALFVPFICGVVGVAVCWAGFLALFYAPASGIVAIGGGLVSLAVGLLIGLLIFKILVLFVPPLLRGFVNLCRRPFERRKRS